MDSKYQLAIINREEKKKKSKKYRSGKERRMRKKLRSLSCQGMGCPWVGRGIVYRVETCWENKLEEQSNFSLHWITVRMVGGKEKQKYLHYFNNIGTQLKSGETIELRHLLCYLDSWWQENYFKQPETRQINNCFIYEAKRVGDKSIYYPTARRIWNRTSFEECPISPEMLAIYKSFIWHQNAS